TVLDGNSTNRFNMKGRTRAKIRYVTEVCAGEKTVMQVSENKRRILLRFNKRSGICTILCHVLISLLLEIFTVNFGVSQIVSRESSFSQLFCKHSCTINRLFNIVSGCSDHDSLLFSSQISLGCLLKSIAINFPLGGRQWCLLMSGSLTYPQQ